MGQGQALAAVEWTPAGQRSLRELMSWLREQPFGNADVAEAQIHHAIERLRVFPERFVVVGSAGRHGASGRARSTSPTRQSAIPSGATPTTASRRHLCLPPTRSGRMWLLAQTPGRASERLPPWYITRPAGPPRHQRSRRLFQDHHDRQNHLHPDG
jgi:hypothetical protein